MNVYLRYGLCVAMGIVWSSRVSAGDSFEVVRVADMMHEETFQVMSADEFKQLQKQIAVEERNFPKAVAAVAEEWGKDEMNKKTPFPGGRLSARKIVGQPETFADRTKADARVEQYQKREDDKRARELDKPGAKKTKTAADKLKEGREADKVLQARRAADLVAAKLAELTGGEAPAAGAKPDDKKVDDKKPADKPAADKPAADKKAAGGAVNKAL